MADISWQSARGCGRNCGRETASKRLTCLDINASVERICAMPFGYHVGDSESFFNIDFTILGNSPFEVVQ